MSSSRRSQSERERMAVFRKVAYAQNQPQIASTSQKLLTGPTSTDPKPPSTSTPPTGPKLLKGPVATPKAVPPVRNPGLLRRMSGAIAGGARRMAGGSRIGAAGLLLTGGATATLGAKKMKKDMQDNAAQIQSPWMRTP